MPRVLHLCPTDADFQTRSFLDALKRDASGQVQHEVLAIGRGGDFWLPISALLALRRRNESSPHLIHAWSLPALRSAAFTNIPHLIYSPSSDPDRIEVKWVRSIGAYRDLHLICSTDTMRRRFVEGGVPMERTHLIRPGVSLAKSRRRRNDALRVELGFKPDDVITLAPGESTRQAAHEDALYAVTLLNVLDRGNRLLTWGRGPRAAAVRRFAVRLKQPTHVDATHTLRRQIEFEDLLGVADEVLITASAPVPTLAICICMSAGLPIVSTVTETIAELLEDRHTAAFVTQHSPRVITQRILNLRADPSLQWSISDRAHTEAYEFFSMSRFLEEHRAVYKNTIEQKTVQLATKAPHPTLSPECRGEGE